MFTATLETDEFRTGVRQFNYQLNTEIHNAVAYASKTGRDHARKGGKFQNRTGWLRRSIQVEKVRRNRNTWLGGYVAKADYARFVEEGTDPHEIRPRDYSGGPSGRRKGVFHTSGRRAGKRVKNPTHGAGRGKFLRFRIGGRVIFAKKVWHPGTKPDPFMEPSMEAAEDALYDRVNKGVDRLSKIWGR